MSLHRVRSQWMATRTAASTACAACCASSCAAVERDRERVSGAWVFRGTRVPVATLFENLEDGVSVGEFVEIFPV